MKKIAIIPARGGSKRFPRKNIIAFKGKPIIAFTIETALEAGIFEKIIVSTEDEEIGGVAQKYGAEILRRPQHLATDTARVVDVCLNVLKLEERQERSYDILCCLYATAPLRTAEDIIKTVGLVESGECDFANGVTAFHFPPHQALRENDQGFLEPMWPDWIHKRSQEVPHLMVDNGSTYAVRVSEFRSVKSFYGPRQKGYYMPHERSVDLDVPEDLDMAIYFAERLVS